MTNYDEEDASDCIFDAIDTVVQPHQLPQEKLHYLFWKSLFAKHT
jgi:hypothetical protein